MEGNMETNNTETTATVETREPKFRDIIMNISPDADSKQAKVSYRITVRFIFTDLTEQQIIDLLFDSSSLRVKFQNHHRAKGSAHLAELAKKEFVEWKVQPSGTRLQSTTRAMTPAEMVAHFAKDPAALQEYIAQLMAIKSGSGIDI